MIKEFKTSVELERMIVHQLNYLGFSNVDRITVVGRAENWKVSSFRTSEDHALIAHLILPIVKRMQAQYEINDSTLIPLFEPSLEGLATG